LQIDELLDVLETLADLGLAARIQDTRHDRWILACDPAAAPLAPLVDRLLLDRHHPWLQDDPALKQACAALLAGHQPAPTLGPILQSPAPALRMAYAREADGAAPLMTEPARSTETHHAQS